MSVCPTKSTNPLTHQDRPERVSSTTYYDYNRGRDAGGAVVDKCKYTIKCSTGKSLICSLAYCGYGGGLQVNRSLRCWFMPTIFYELPWTKWP